MQFVCNSCGAKYTISADRVKGRVLKIRCRDCGEIIEIRGDGFAVGEMLTETGSRKKAGSSKDLSENYKLSSLKDRFKESFAAKGTSKVPLADTGKPAESPPPRAPSPRSRRHAEAKDPKRWYVAVRNQPVGPVSKTRVRTYLRKKEADGDSLAWREGFDDWKPLRDVPELNDLLEEIEAPVPVPTDAAAPPAPEQEPGPEEEIPPPPSPPQDDALRGYHVGRIDAQADVAEAQMAGQALEHDVFRPVGAPLAEPRRSPLKRLLDNRIALVSIGALALLLPFGVTMLVITLTHNEPTEPPPEPRLVEEEAPLEDHSERGNILAGLTITLEDVIEEELAAGSDPTQQSDSKPVSGGKSKTVKKSSETSSEGGGSPLPSMYGIKEKSVSTSALGKSSGKKKKGLSGQNGLSDSEIRGVVKKNSKAIRKCYEKVLGKGMGVDQDIKVQIKVNVGTSGMVTKAKVTSITAYGNFLTPCIESAIKTWVFPRASSPSEFIFPILLTPKN